MVEVITVAITVVMEVDIMDIMNTVDTGAMEDMEDMEAIIAVRDMDMAIVGKASMVKSKKKSIKKLENV